MQKVTLTKSGLSNSRNGVQFVDKNGKNYYKAYIQVQEYPGKYINKNYVFESEIEIIKGWKPGAVVEVEIKEEEYNGKMYLNFKLPQQRVSRKEFDALESRVKQLHNLLGNLQDRVSRLEGDRIINPMSDRETQITQDELEPDDEVPF